MSSRWLRENRVPVAFVLLAVSWIGWLLATGHEISVWGDLRRDVVLRDGVSPELINDIRFYDSSPYSIWLPSDTFVWDSVRRLEVPLWDRSQAGGYSPVLNLQNGVLHPLRWASAFFPRELASSAIIIMALLSLAVGMFEMLKRVFDTSEPAATLGAIVAILSGCVMSTVHFSGMLIPLVHVPWLILVFAAWMNDRRTVLAVAFALTLASLVLSGHPLIIAVAAIVAFSVIGWRLLTLGTARDFLGGLGLIISGGLITSAAMIPMMLNLGNLWSYKNATPEGVSYDVLQDVSGFDALLSVLNYAPYPTDLMDGGPIVFHLGAAAALLMVTGLVVVSRQRATRIVLALVIVGWLLSMPPEWLVHLAVGTPLGYYKPWYLVFVFVFPATIAVAIGFDRALELVPARLETIAVLMIYGAVIVTALAPAKAVLRVQPRAALDSPAIRFFADVNTPFRVVGLSGQTHVPNVSAITRIEDVRFSSPVQPLRYHEWIRLAAPEWSDAFPTSTLLHDANSPMLRAFNVRYVLRSLVPGHDVQTFLPRPGHKVPRDYLIDPAPAAESFRPIFEGGSVEVHEAIVGLHPRAHFVDDFVAVEGGLEAAVKTIRDLEGLSTEVVEVPGPGLLDGVQPSTDGDRVQVRYPASRMVSIRTRASGTRLLVLHDSWDRGWRAWIDGDDATILPVSLISRGVIVPEGEHEVVMSFAPVGSGLGLLASILGVVLCLPISGWARKKGAGS